jgi:Protein of unknown function (DUF1549)/Protein of unknown function (DUF1553)
MMVKRAIQPAFVFMLAGGLLVSATANAQVQTPAQSGIINEHLSKAWKDNSLTPAKAATDNEFIRRVFLDVLGRIPTAEEVREYERDKSPNKRAKLIHRILHEEAYKLKNAAGGDLLDEKKKPFVFEYYKEYAEHWSDIWAVWLMTRTGTNDDYHTQMKKWLDAQFMKNVGHDQLVRQLLTATGTNKPDASDKNPAVNFIMAHLGEKTPDLRKKDKEEENRPVTDGPFDYVPITSRVTRLFLGIQTQCTQCHDHPFNPEWGQENFWGVNAFFRQVARNGDPTPTDALRKKKDKNMPVQSVVIKDDPSLNVSARIYYERRTGVLMSMKPQFLPDLAELEKDRGERAKKLIPANARSRRDALADYTIAHDNFAKAYVNRIWAHFFGRGLNEQATADDFGGHNKVIHPEMLSKLAHEFIRYKYDPKALIEWICNSDAYSLSYVAPNKDMTKPEYDVFFAKMPLKAVSPEVLFEALTTATKADLQVDPETRKSNRDRWMEKLVNNFGDDEGNEMTFNGTIVQALLMMNGAELNAEIRRSDGTVAKVLEKAQKLAPGARDSFVIEELYLTALSRRPSATTMVEIDIINPKTKKKTGVSKISELAFVQQQMAHAKNNPATPDPKGKGKASGGGDPYKQFCEDLFWSLLNTNEFMLNH